MDAIVKDLLLSGHTLLDYQHMFDLTDDDLQKSFVTCASGFDTFNAEMTQLGHRVVSCARNYNLSVDEMQALVKKNLARMEHHLESNQEQYLFDPKMSFADVKQRWLAVAERFVADYAAGQKAERYRPDVLPKLGFADNEFDFCLCSHFLFSHSELSLAAHIAFIKEMARVAKEVRVFPLSNSFGEISSLLGPVMLALQQEQYGTEIMQVSYEFQRGSNAMMRIWATTCAV